MSEQSKAQVRRIVEQVYDGGRLAVVDEAVASAVVIHAAPRETVGRDGPARSGSAKDPR
jgi:hypothetical protein